MKTFAIADSGAAPTAIEAPVPTLENGQVLVRVLASSVNATDTGTASGMFAGFGIPHQYPVTLGRDFAGTVESVGKGVASLSIGDSVFGELPFNPPLREGTWSDYIVSDETTLVRRPGNVDLTTAGAASLAGITGIMTVDALSLRPGDRVLVVGATGGVGTVVVQLAAAAGAHILAPALPRDEAFLRGLGVTEILARDADTVAAVRELHPNGVDAIVDLVSIGAAGAIGVYDQALTVGGRVASATNAAGEGPGRTNVNHAPDQEILTRLADLLSAGTLRIPISGIFTFTQLPEALNAFQNTHLQGKIALRRDEH